MSIPEPQTPPAHIKRHVLDVASKIMAYQGGWEQDNGAGIWTTMGVRDLQGQPVGAQRTPTLEQDEEASDNYSRLLVLWELKKLEDARIGNVVERSDVLWSGCPRTPLAG